ncbi:MAG: hypothetical protein V7731_01255 [Amphritea sp.]
MRKQTDVFSPASQGCGGHGLKTKRRKKMEGIVVTIPELQNCTIQELHGLFRKVAQVAANEPSGKAHNAASMENIKRTLIIKQQQLEVPAPGF